MPQGGTSIYYTGFPLCFVTVSLSSQHPLAFGITVGLILQALLIMTSFGSTFEFISLEHMSLVQYKRPSFKVWYLNSVTSLGWSWDNAWCLEQQVMFLSWSLVFVAPLEVGYEIPLLRASLEIHCGQFLNLGRSLVSWARLEFDSLSQLGVCLFEPCRNSSPWVMSEQSSSS